MDRVTTQKALEELHNKYKGKLDFSKENVERLSSPLLLNITADYIAAKRRVLFLGRKTKGWQWDGTLNDKVAHPRWTYAQPWIPGRAFLQRI